MNRAWTAGLAAASLGVAGAAQAQDDDWEFAEDAGQRLSVAAARYDGGSAIIAQCRDGALTLVMAGLPQATEPVDFAATRADGRRDVQTWAPAPGSPGAYRSANPARDIRFMRGGGAYVIRTAEGEATRFGGTFDLPTQTANLDRVLTACGWPLSDDRDGLALAGDISLTDPEAGPGRRRMPTRRGATSRAPRREIEPPLAAGTPPPAAEQTVSCVIRGMHLRECRAAHPGSANDLADTVRWHEGRQVWATGDAPASDLEGRAVYFSVSTILIPVARLSG